MVSCRLLTVLGIVLAFNILFFDLSLVSLETLLNAAFIVTISFEICNITLILHKFAHLV